MPESPSWLRRYVFSTDHKAIGIQYILTGLVMAVAGAGLALLIRLQLGWPTDPKPLLGALFPAGMPGGIMTPEFYLALVTMHGTIMVFFFVSYVLVSGFGNYLIPLQIGARDMAFPFLDVLSYWVAFLAAVGMLLSFLVEGGAAAAGWTAYPPLSAVAAAAPGSGLGQTVWLLSMALFIASFTMSGLNFIATIFCLRAPGMSMLRMPLTVWSYFISAILGVLAFPPLTAAAIMLLFDRHLGTSFFLPGGLVVANELLSTQGGSPLLWQHLFWFLGHPEVYVLILPALGIAAGRPASDNPWEATTLEWTVASPPPHGNSRGAPAVARWPYDYGLDYTPRDYAPQTLAPPGAPAGARNTGARSRT